MTLANSLREFIAACFTGLWIQSHEHEDALTEVNQLCRDENWRLAVWDLEQGLRIPGQQSDTDTAATDPLAAIRSLNALAVPDSSALLVLVNFHRFLNSAEIVQALARQIVDGKQNRTFVVILSPLVQVPTELEKHLVVVEHELPSRTQLEDIARGVATEGGELPAGDELGPVLDAAAGLTRYEAEGAFGLSLVRDGRIKPHAIWELKSQMLKKSGLLTLHRGSESFAQLGGLDALKSFCLRATRNQGHRNPLKRPRGVLLLSPPGCGKSAFAKALGTEIGRPTLTLDIGSLMGSLVGQTEGNIRQALKIADAMAPCVLYLDELEKGLAGVGSSGSSDSGVSARLFGTFLTWLNDHASDVLTIATVNCIAKLPPEFARAERFDGVFFLDLPGATQKAKIWEIYVRLFELDPDQPRPKTSDWTGAEIRACCRLAALLDVPLLEAATNVVPVAVTAAESVEQLRNWASGRCLDADTPGIYQRNCADSSKKSRRSIARDPSELIRVLRYWHAVPFPGGFHYDQSTCSGPAMSKPIIHAKNSARKFGGRPEDYLAVHQQLDSTKNCLADNRHRALTHNAWYVGVGGPLELIFGVELVNSQGVAVPVRTIGEQHVLEDFGGFIPTVQDYLAALPLEPWMCGVGRPSSCYQLALPTRIRPGD